VKQALKRLATLGLQGDFNAALKYQFRYRLLQLYRSGNISTVYDIGAHHGKWSLGMKKLMPKASFQLFEANPVCETFLKKTGLPYHRIALSKAKGKRVFHSNNSTGDSFYPENTKLSGVFGWQEKEVETADLDSFAVQNHLPSPDWIKLDVQGAELDVLAGGKCLFSKSKFLLTEIPLLPYNLGAPSFSDYLDAFGAAGFRPVSVVEVHQLSAKAGNLPALSQMDLFFERQ
jgi:FkbM family methyltransferase